MPRAVKGEFSRIVYRGMRKENLIVVAKSVDGMESVLRPQSKHSPNGFNWGVLDNGALDLARSILVDALGNFILAREDIYEKFAREFVVGWKDSWIMGIAEVRRWYLKLQRKSV